jgi:hypothetical protein
MDDRQLIADLLSALEYHTEQTKPIEFSKVAIQAAHEYLRKPAHQRIWVGLTHEEIDYQARKDDHAIYFALGALWAEAKLKELNT